MGFSDIFKGKQYKAELEDLQQKYDDLQKLMTPELQDAFSLQNKIRELQTEIEQRNQTISEIQKEIIRKNTESSRLEKEISGKRKEIISLDDEILVQEFGLYKPQYNFANALGYKEKLAEIRSKQKNLIKEKRAVSGSTDWQVNGSAAKGKKMVADTQKLLLRAFNTECDEIIGKVKYTNFDASSNRIYKSAETISKLGTIMNIAINKPYLDLKVQELRLAFEYQQKKQEEKEAQKAARAEEYQQKKQEEKEAQKAARAEMREAARLQKEIEAQRKKIEKEQTHYQTAYEKILKQLETAPADTDLLKKKSELETQLQDIDKAIQDIDYREANQRAGYVYVISNIGAFGDNVYKIGMTRRLDPQDRIDELGDASVPFNFDVHAMIFSDDAPALETALHKAFEDRKLNMVNTRREFFNVTLDEIKDVVRKNFDKTVEFIDVPDAEQYRISQKMKHQNV